MIKMLILGVWASLMSLGAAFGVMTWQNAKPQEDVAPPPPAATLLRTRTISVPMLLEGQVRRVTFRVYGRHSQAFVVRCDA